MIFEIAYMLDYKLHVLNKQ